MKNIRLVNIDLDGTLLPPMGEFSGAKFTLSHRGHNIQYFNRVSRLPLVTRET